jgi:hypothetical protein
MRGATGGAAMGGTYGESNWRADEEYREGIREFSETGPAAAARGRDENAARGASAESETAGREPPAEDDSEW